MSDLLSEILTSPVVAGLGGVVVGGLVAGIFTLRANKQNLKHQETESEKAFSRAKAMKDRDDLIALLIGVQTEARAMSELSDTALAQTDRAKYDELLTRADVTAGTELSKLFRSLDVKYRAVRGLGPVLRPSDSSELRKLAGQIRGLVQGKIGELMEIQL